MNEETTSTAGRIVGALAIGALIGAGVALLYAPQSGQETRQLLTRKTRDLKDKASGVLTDAQHLVHDKKAQVIAAVEAGKEAMEHEAARQRRAA